ncbi:MAG TPA: CMP-binding protein [Planctomycetaceae bacterium]|nr:CMP-binding protein [Planctomycetaceae bacterium]
MQRQYISDLQPRETVDEIYRVADKQVRSNRQGNEYLLLQLMDRSGQISGLRWNVGQEIYETFQRGDYLRIAGATQLHNGMMQIIVQDFSLVTSDQVDASHFSKRDEAQIDALQSQLAEKLRSVKCAHLQRLVEDYLSDARLMEALSRAPAGIKTHHAYEGGLLRHVVDLLAMADAIAPSYPQLDRDLLIVGVFLHDLGKIEELSFDADLSYTDAGQLLGHLVQGAIEVQNRATKLAEQGQAIPDETVLRLQHMVVSHHRELEHGSPKVPMTLEAIVLAYLDDMDAKMNAAMELIASDRNTDSDWTNYNPTLGRKLYKPSAKA